MKKVLNLLAVLVFTCAFASLANAQATRTWVSGVGDDANPCSRTAPCKTFAGAISKTANCGEIDALDPGGFGAVTITKGITIDGTGTLAGILASLTTGITVNVASPTVDVVTIRGLSINGSCNGIRGMNIIAAKEVNVEDCVIFRFTNEGILVNTTAASVLNVRNSVIRDNTGDGVGAGTSAGQVKGTLINSSFVGNGTGIHGKNNARLVAEHCNISSSANNGVLADNATAGVVRVSNSVISNNGTNGVNASGASVVEINSNDIYNNGGNGALASGGGVVQTFGNNRILANAVDGCPGCTPVGPTN